MPGARLNQSAFTFTEILIAIVVLAIGMLSLASMSYVVIRGNVIGKQFTAASTLAQDKMEELKNKDYADSDLNDNNSGNNTDLQSTTTTDYQEANIDVEGNSGGIYTRIVNIADDVPITDVKTIVVIVTWTDAQQQSRKISLSTIKSS